MRFKVKDSNLFPLKNNPHMLHLATIGYSLREFCAMACVYGPHKGKVYIEELVHNTVDFTQDVYANFKFISDDNLAADLANYCTEQGLLDVGARVKEGLETGVIKWDQVVNPGSKK